MRYGWCVVPVVAAFAGCAAPHACDVGCVSQKVESRFAAPVRTPPVGQPIVPPGLDLGQPLAEDHAVLLALWNNALFQENLLELQLTRADLVTAGLLPNPELLYYFSAPAKPFRYLIDFPIESLWLRPVRLRVAGAENARACERVTQLALDLIRDTRQAYADLRLARERVRVAEEAVKLRGRIAELAEARLAAGDISAQEAATARIDAILAKQDAARIGYEVPLAEERLRNLLGLTDTTVPLVTEELTQEWQPPPDVEELVQAAVRSRPDAAAAAHAAAAAAERLRVARVSWFRFLGILDATTGLKTDHEFGPGFRVTLPIFNHGQGAIARAEAEYEQLERRRVTVHNQIVLDVRLAHARYRQALAEYDVLRGKVRPEVEASIGRTQRAYEAGNASYVLTLEATRQRIDTDFRTAQLRADLRRAWAELERSAGFRLGGDRGQGAGGSPAPVQLPNVPAVPSNP